MKQLNKYISESIYTNLGLNDEIAKEFVSEYNKAGIYSCRWVSGNTVEFINHININEDNEHLLDDGHLPDGINFTVNYDGAVFTVSIASKKFTSFKNFPKITTPYIKLYRSGKVNLGTLDKYSSLDLNIGSGAIGNVKDLSVVKSPLTGLTLTSISTSPLSNLSEILRNTKGLEFVGSSYNIPNLWMCTANVRSTDLARFFENNKFPRKRLDLLIRANVDSFDFVDEMSSKLYCSLKLMDTDKFDPDKYDGLFRNSDMMGSIEIVDNKKFVDEANEYARTYPYRGRRKISFINK